MSNTPPLKDHITTLLNDMIAAINGIDPQRAALLSSLETRRVASTANFTDPVLALGITVDAKTVVEVILVAANTAGATLQVTGDVARTMRTERRLALPATCDQISDEQLARTTAIAAAISAETTARAAAEDGDLRVMAEDRTVVVGGAPRATIDANADATAANAINWVFPTAAVDAGDAARFHAQIAVAGLIRFGVYPDVGDNLVHVRTRDIVVLAGYVDISVGCTSTPATAWVRSWALPACAFCRAAARDIISTHQPPIRP